MASDDQIWVICIAYDYGVWSRAGYFRKQADAQAWCDAHNHDRDDTCEFYPVAVEPSNETR